MIIVSLVFLLVIGLGLLLLRGRYDKEIEGLNKKENVLRFFYPLSFQIISKVRLLKKQSLFRHFISVRGLSPSKTEMMLEEVYMKKPEQDLLVLFRAKQIAIVLLTLIIACVFIIIAEIAMGDALNLQTLNRPDYGSSPVTYQLDVQDKNNLSAEKESVEIEIYNRVYSAEEVEVLFERAYEELKVNMLKENESLDCICSDLYFADSALDSLISVTWNPEEIAWIDFQGTINQKDIPKEGVITYLSMELSYESYQEVYQVALRLMRPEKNAKEQWRENLLSSIKELEAKNRQENQLMLPVEHDGIFLTYSLNNDTLTPGNFLLLTCLIALLAVLYYQEGLKKKVKERNQQMQQDYPEIVSKLTLLINAGLAPLGAWESVVCHYQQQREPQNSNKRYAYEEMAVTLHQIKGGTSQSDAYQQFGKRARLHSYIRLGNLLAESIRKGNQDLCQRLKHESQHSFEERKQRAKRLGEEAGTKLLAPMIMMFIVVMILIMVPGFLSLY